MKKTTSNTSILFILTLLLGMNTYATTKTSSQSGNWSSTTTWGGNPAPTNGDDVIINGGFTVTVDIPNATCLSIQLGGSVLNSGTGTLSFSNGSQLIVSGGVNIGPLNNNNTAGSLNMNSGGILTCQSILVGRLGTWTEGTGTIEFTASNAIPAGNLINFNNLTLSSGTTSFTRNVSVIGNLLINPGANLDCGAITMSLSGNFINNGTFTGNTGTLSFVKNGNQTISGTGTNNFNLIRVNLGTGINNILEVISSNFNAPDAFLTLTNGTFKMSGTFTLSNTFMTGPIYNIQPGTGFWLNNPNVTVTGQTGGGASVRGLLRLSAGTIDIGTASDNSLDYVAGSVINIEGGSLNIAGRLTRNNATATTTYSQSGGTVTVVGQGSTDPTFAGFDLGAVGSSFTMSGGTIVIRNATAAPTDFLNASAVSTVTGGTLQIGDNSTGNAQIIRINSSHPIGNLFVSNATTQAVKPTAQLIISSLNVTGNITLQTGTSMDTNGLNLTLGGDWTNNGIFTNGGNTVSFNGIGAQSLINPGGETFNNLSINKVSGTLSLNSNVTVNNSFTLTGGTINIGNNILTFNGSVSGGGILSGSNAGTVIYNQNSAGQNVLSGNYDKLIFSNFDKILPFTGTINIAGSFTPGSGAGHTITGSTFDFNGGDQPVPSFNYYHLTLSGSGVKTGSGNVTVTGDLTINAGINFTGSTILGLNGTHQINNGQISASSIIVGTGSTFLNNGTITAGSDLSGNGTLTQGTTAVLNIGGTAGITTLNSVAAGNTVNYTGSSQLLAPVIYHHLTLSGTGSIVLNGINTINGNFIQSGSVSTIASTGLIIGGNLSIGTGTAFNASTFTHTLKGNLINSGIFDAGTSTFLLDGTGVQTINAPVINNLSVNNNAGVIMLTDEAINGILTLTNGSFSIGSNSLTLNGTILMSGGSLTGGTTSNIFISGSGATTVLPQVILNNFTLNRAAGASISGDLTVNGQMTISNGSLFTGVNSVILGPGGILSEASGQTISGNIKTTRNVTAVSGIESFGNIGAEIILNGIAIGNTTVLRKTGAASIGINHSSILRNYDITPSVNSGLNAGLIFHYDNFELTGQNANILELYKSTDNGATWNNQGGASNTVSRTITATGINNFSQWTASDTINRIGNSARPTVSAIYPLTNNYGNPGFLLTVNGTNFIKGKSTVRFNGSDRTTTFVNPTQLSAQLTANDLLALGQFQITVFNISGGGLSDFQTFTVVPNTPVKIQLETLADGSGTPISNQTISSGNTIILFSIARDAFNNFVANIPADSWLTEHITGGVQVSDLTPSANKKSAVFTGRIIGTSDILATSGALTSIASGVITVIPGSATKILPETLENGTGSLVSDQSINIGSSITLFAITRDDSNNFIANVPAEAWNLQNISGEIAASDLVSSTDSKSATFTGHSPGTTLINATSGTLTAFATGLITVKSITGLINEKELPSFALLQNYPNPFNSITTIIYQISVRNLVILKVFDLNGKEVRLLVNQTEDPGVKTVIFDGSQLTNGMYFYRLQAGNFNETRKFLIYH